MKNLPVGTQIIANNKTHKELVGMTGTIVEIVDGAYGVEIDNSNEVYLHDCNGKATPRWGWYFNFDEVDEMINSYNCRTSVRNKDISKAIRKNTNTKIGEGDYSAKVNGTIISVYNHAERIGIIANGVVIRLSCKSSDDETYMNHVFDAFRIAEGKAILGNTLIDFTEEMTPKQPETAVEITIQEPIEKPIDPPTEIKRPVGRPRKVIPEEVAKVYATEEELLADLGIKK
jgi:hypothetical protein